MSRRSQKRKFNRNEEAWVRYRYALHKWKNREPSRWRIFAHYKWRKERPYEPKDVAEYEAIYESWQNRKWPYRNFRRLW